MEFTTKSKESIISEYYAGIQQNLHTRWDKDTIVRRIDNIRDDKHCLKLGLAYLALRNQKHAIFNKVIEPNAITQHNYYVGYDQLQHLFLLYLRLAGRNLMVSHRCKEYLIQQPLAAIEILYIMLYTVTGYKRLMQFIAAQYRLSSKDIERLFMEVGTIE